MADLDDAELTRLRNIYTYHPPRPGSVPVFEAIRQAGFEMSRAILENCPPSRERSLALTDIQGAVMWANASIALAP